jgi:hypothetical protein
MSIATTPTHALTGSPRRDRVADARWAEWRPLWLVWKSQFHDIYQNEDAARDVHFRWLQQLLAQGIPMRMIRTRALDDPREHRDLLAERVQRYNDRVIIRRKRNADIR